MTHFFKHIVPWQVIITVIYLIYMFINNDFYKFLMAAIPAVFLMLKIYYDKSKYVFIFYRKLVAKINNPTVYWESSTYYNLKGDIDFTELATNYVETLRNNNYDIKNISHNDCLLNLKINGSNIEITHDNENRTITFSYESKISYKESVKEFNDKFYKLLEILKNITANENFNFLYRVDLKFDKLNPFYSLYVKNYTDAEILDFNIKYNISNIDFEVLKNSMVIKTNDRELMSNIIKNYLIISN